MKVILHDGDQKHELFIQRELECLRRVSHPHIVRVLEVIEEFRRLHIVMELLEGGELLDVVNARAPFPDWEAALVTKQVVSAIAHLHEIGIVHRDIKLENIICTRRGTREVKLVDFGFSRIYEAVGLMDSTVGTDSYMSGASPLPLSLLH